MRTPVAAYPIVMTGSGGGGSGGYNWPDPKFKSFVSNGDGAPLDSGAYFIPYFPALGYRGWSMSTSIGGTAGYEYPDDNLMQVYDEIPAVGTSDYSRLSYQFRQVQSQNSTQTVYSEQIEAAFGNTPAIGDWVDYSLNFSIGSNSHTFGIHLSSLDADPSLTGFVFGRPVFGAAAVKENQFPILSQVKDLTGLSSNPFLQGANVMNCTQIAGFSNAFRAMKVTAIGSGTVSKMSCYIFNSYGNRKIRMGIYTQAGVLIQQTVVITLAAGQNLTAVANLEAAVTVASGSQYWIGVWGDGVDIPECLTFSPYSSTFPDGMHAVENTTATSLPATISATTPFATTSRTIPVQCFG